MPRSPSRLFRRGLARSGAVDCVGADVHAPDRVALDVENGAQIAFDADGKDGYAVFVRRPVDFVRTRLDLATGRLHGTDWAMKTIHAVYEDGVFRPKERVELPEKCEVEFEPRPVHTEANAAAMAEIYAILSERYASGEHDVAARHNEHQP